MERPQLKGKSGSALVLFHPSSCTGISIPYPTISLHAVSRQPILADPASSTAHPGTTEQPCVYCQLDENEGEDYDNLPEDELAETKELGLFPSSPEAGQWPEKQQTRLHLLTPSLQSKPSTQQCRSAQACTLRQMQETGRRKPWQTVMAMQTGRSC